MNRLGRGIDAADGAMLAVAFIWAATNVVVKAVLDAPAPLAHRGVSIALVVNLALGFGWPLTAAGRTAAWRATA